jgi:hypothetical protein
MATWAKKDAMVFLVDETTGEFYETLATVEYQPVTSAYPTNKVDATQLSSLYAYKPNSDLDTTLAYDIYVNGSKTIRIWGTDLLPMGTG